MTCPGAEKQKRRQSTSLQDMIPASTRASRACFGRLVLLSALTPFVAKQKRVLLYGLSPLRDFSATVAQLPCERLGLVSQGLYVCGGISSPQGGVTRRQQPLCLARGQPGAPENALKVALRG